MNQKITSITAQKRPGRFNVFLDGNYAFSVSEEVLVKFQLSKGKELDSADLEEIFKADDLSKALNKALDYLSYSLRTEKETRQKLAKEGLEDDIIETVVKKLTKMKLLNDSEYAKSYVRTMAKTTEKGPRFIANSLKEKGYNPVNQLVGYLLSGDPTYITNYNGARALVRKLERDEILEEVIKSYLEIK